MKVLVGLSKRGFEDNEPYRMCIVETDEIKGVKRSSEWEDLDVSKLSECSNINISAENFKDNMQNPNEYINADFDIERLIGWGRNQKDFQVTNVYYDEFNQPQLYRVVSSNGYISMHDISELEYRKKSSILGGTLEELPSFVKKEPLGNAYEWWKARDEAGKKSESRFFSSQFETYESMPVKLLYHYLTGVKGFNVGYHTITEITEDYLSEIQHEYMLFKDTANIKLRESVPKEKNMHSLYSFGGYDMFGEEKDPYPTKRKISYYGATMSMICTRENYPTFDIHHRPRSQCSYDKDGIAIDITYRNGLMSIYNKLEENGCISKDWRLNEYNSFFDITESALLPEELALLSARLQSEKEGVIYGHVMSSTRGHWSTFNTDEWIKAIGLALSTQFYSPELREKINPILQSYQVLYSSKLGKMIEDMGAKDSLEVMKWTKENAKNVLQDISLVREDGTLQKSNVSIVDQMSNLFTYKRNNYPLPDWLQIYSTETIEVLGGVELLQQAINTKGEKVLKESIPILAEGIESERRYELRKKGERFVKTEEVITEDTFSEEANYSDQSSGIRR